MATLSDEEQQLIQRDREENPGCFYSTALSQSCRSINGDSKCEIIKKIFRQCPGRNKELISNRKEVTEDEHGGELSAGDFFNRERMDPRKSDESPFGSFFHPFQREDEFDAQMSPFDFLRQEMLRPFEGFFGGSAGFGFGGDDRSGGGNIFDAFEREFERTPQPPTASQVPPTRRSPVPANPPHYAFQPAKDRRDAGAAKAHADEQRDIFDGYSGRVRLQELWPTQQQHKLHRQYAHMPLLLFPPQHLYIASYISIGVSDLVFKKRIGTLQQSKVEQFVCS